MKRCAIGNEDELIELSAQSVNYNCKWISFSSTTMDHNHICDDNIIIRSGK